MSTTLVTGATGFIGSHLCHALQSLGHDVIAIGRPGERNAPCTKYIQAELDEIPFDILPKIDVCFHQAANNDTKHQDYVSMCDANVVRPSRLFDRLVKHGCKNFVYASSCSIYGKAVPPFFEAQDPQPLNSYARSKLIFEGYAKKLSKQKDIKAVGLRYSNVYGYGESHKGARASMVHQITERAVCGREVVLFKNGEQMRDWIYIDDVIAANLLAMNSQVPGIMNVGSGTSISFNDLVGLIGKVVGKDLQVRYIECDFQSSYQSHTYVNLKHSEETYGFQPKWKLDSGIAEIVRKMKEGQ